MVKRLQLQTLLEELLGSRNVYFQPPETVSLKYPCIIYSLVDVDSKYANNLPYANQAQYSIMVIDSNPDSLTPGKIRQLPTSKFDRRYTKNNLNHSVYKLYY